MTTSPGSSGLPTAAGVADATAVVFAYSEVGVRGLAALLAAGADVRLVITHEDAPGEHRWFDSVADLARLHGIEVVAPARPNDGALAPRLRTIQPRWIFSLYYRHLLADELLSLARDGAYNLHGSLLPHYRGRAPVNWAILNGESRTGASLHRMVKRPDAGEVLDREAVPILPNDTALAVSRKVAWAAETVLLRTLPRLRDGTAAGQPQDLAAGSYFGRRRPEDGGIDWSRPAGAVHDQVRGLAPPFPGAFTDTPAGRLVLAGSYYRGLQARGAGPRLYWQDGTCWADCADGRRFEVLGLELDGTLLDRAAFGRLFGEVLVPA